MSTLGSEADASQVLLSPMQRHFDERRTSSDTKETRPKVSLDDMLDDTRHR